MFALSKVKIDVATIYCTKLSITIREMKLYISNKNEIQNRTIFSKNNILMQIDYK